MAFQFPPSLRSWVHFLRIPNQLLLWICVWFFSKNALITHVWMWGGSFSLMLFAANGWNDWLDVKADERNRPGTNPFQFVKNKKTVLGILGTAMLASLLMGCWYLKELNGIQRWGWVLWLGLVPGLFAYSKWWQQVWLWKNISASSLTASGVLSLGWITMGDAFPIALFGLVWLANFWREMVKDVIDANGDANLKKGNVTRIFTIQHIQILLTGSAIFSAFLMYPLLQHFVWWEGLGLISPPLVFLFLTWTKHWNLASLVLKIWMALGLIIWL